MELSNDELRVIVLMEARAKPRLRNVDGLWRRPVLGRRGAPPRPGSITQFIRDRGLPPPDEVDHIVATAPAELLAFQSALPVDERSSMGCWLERFHRAAGALAPCRSHITNIATCAVRPTASPVPDLVTLLPPAT